MSDDTPTQRFDTPPPDAPDAPAGPAGEPKKSRGLLIALIIVGAALLIALIVVLFLLLGNNGKPTAAVTATTSDTPSTTPSVPPSTPPAATPAASSAPTTSPAPPPPPPPPSTKVAITGYSISPSQITCSNGTPNLAIHWSSVNGKTAYFGVNTADAQSGGMGWELPPTGSDANFPAGYHPYPAICGQDTEYTITIVGTDGSKVSKMFTVKFTN